LVPDDSERAVETFDEWRPRVPGGPPLPYSRDEIVDAVDRGMTFDLREVHPDRLARVLGGPPPAAGPALGDGTAAAGRPPADTFAADALVPLLLWQPLARDPRVEHHHAQRSGSLRHLHQGGRCCGRAFVSSPWVFYQLWTFVAAGL